MCEKKSEEAPSKLSKNTYLDNTGIGITHLNKEILRKQIQEIKKVFSDFPLERLKKKEKQNV